MSAISELIARRGRRAESASYAAFISYSHAVDGRLAPALQQALHGFARPWYRLRALRVFRDESTLAVSPGLWSSIEQALAGSRWFILLASPEAAASPWVQREVGYWCREKSPSTLLIVLTGGTLAWRPDGRDFDWAATTALPRSQLERVFPEEPRYIDLSWARQEEHLSLNHPRFRNCVADLAAPLHGQSKDELVGEDVRQHRRTVRLARSVIAALTALTLVVGVLGLVARSNAEEARVQRDQARVQRDQAISRQLAALAAADLQDRPDRPSWRACRPAGPPIPRRPEGPCSRRCSATPGWSP
jgi:TIR domain